jgi:hypothetical protein
MRRLVPHGALAAVVAGLCLTAVTARTVRAQAWNYPAFQPPHIAVRDFNFALSDGGSPGTSALFQWREGMSSRTQLSLDAGIADPNGPTGNVVFFGGQFAHQLAFASADQPLDFLFTAGLNAAFPDNFTLVRVPIGVSIGHRFPLEQGMAITPFVHPRLSIDICSANNNANCGPNNNSNVGLDFDLGADYEVSRQISLRVAAMFGGSDYLNNDAAFGIAMTYRPGALARR